LDLGGPWTLSILVNRLWRHWGRSVAPIGGWRVTTLSAWIGYDAESQRSSPWAGTLSWRALWGDTCNPAWGSGHSSGSPRRITSVYMERLCLPPCMVNRHTHARARAQARLLTSRLSAHPFFVEIITSTCTRGLFGRVFLARQLAVLLIVINVERILFRVWAGYTLPFGEWVLVRWTVNAACLDCHLLYWPTSVYFLHSNEARGETPGFAVRDRQRFFISLFMSSLLLCIRAFWPESVVRIIYRTIQCICMWKTQ